LLEYWDKRLKEVVELNKINFEKDTSELQQEAVKERHRIYCHLLMKLITRFWNGNKRSPFGSYPLRAAQIEPIQSNGPVQPTQRYRGDMINIRTRTRPYRASTGIAILGTTSPSSQSTATAKSSTSISITTTCSEALPSTPNRAW
jgi:hypothetical protein